MKENKFQKKVKEQLEKQAAFVINMHGHLMQRAGLPDLQVLHTRWDGFLELKCEDYEASALQQIIAARIELRGTLCYVLRCREVNMSLIGEINSLIKDEYPYEYTLENFQGCVINTFYDLSTLLDALVELSKPNLEEE